MRLRLGFGESDSVKTAIYFDSRYNTGHVTSSVDNSRPDVFT